MTTTPLPRRPYSLPDLTTDERLLRLRPVADSLLDRRSIRAAAEAEERDFWEGGATPREWLDALAPLGLDWHKPFLTVAPWLVVVFKEVYGIDDEGSKRTNYYVNESVGIACGLFITAIQMMGLATLTHTPQPMRFLNRILDRPANERPYILFPIGLPADDCTVPELPKRTWSERTTWFEPSSEEPSTDVRSRPGPDDESEKY